MSFLTAEWRKLAMANYFIDPQVLQSYLPAGVELDLYHGKCYVSLIGFMFQNVRVLGVKIPNHVNFEEVNLRFYVRRKVNGNWRRGVVFVSEIVPKSVIQWVANTLYGEAYETLPMRHEWKMNKDEISVDYQFKKNEEWQRFTVTASAKSQPLIDHSPTQFITEHYYGYSKGRGSKTTEYEVTHPQWKTYPVTDYTIQIDFQKVYGDNFGFLNAQSPDFVLLAEGSEITIEGKNSF